MSEERLKILELLSKGKISVEEAEKLLAALGEQAGEAGPRPATGGAKPRYLVVNVYSEKGGPDQPEKVNVRVPLQVIRAGVKLASLMPAVAKDKVNEALSEKGIQLDLDKIRPEDIEELVSALGDMTVDINDGREKVRVYCE